ncbi:MAG TPA: energy transducer TonB [Bacteroidales bacterium]|nr:energy transducer TonB [Bacteroidales bacterium]HSA43177.1 energy transducer TonB [Bacteroidales bacterium]
MQDAENTNRPLAWILSLVFHGIILGVLFLIVMHTPIPPYPMVGGGSGLEVNFGTSDQGMGDVQYEEYLAVNTRDLGEAPSEITVQKGKDGTDDNYLTQDIEEAPAIQTSRNNEATKPAEVIKINDPVVNPKALYTGKPKKQGGSEGITGQAGDQGHPGGSLYSKNYDGEPGSGAGTGAGYGVGTGKGDGIGPSFDLSGRSAKFLPKPEYGAYETGTVVVRIWVNKQGAVTRAESGARGTTTSSAVLQRLARQAALQARFSPNPNAPEEQKGSITYHFVLQN